MKLERSLSEQSWKMELAKTEELAEQWRRDCEAAVKAAMDFEQQLGGRGNAQQEKERGDLERRWEAAEKEKWEAMETVQLMTKRIEAAEKAMSDAMLETQRWRRLYEESASSQQASRDSS